MGKMKVVIVGAGIGGMACALASKQEGLDVTLLERAPKLLPVRTFILFQNNAVMDL
jgi:salicylate hydroxylase